MYHPCWECFNRYEHSYTKDCDGKCQYAKAISMLKMLEPYGSIDEIVEVMKGDRLPLALIDKKHIDRTYKIVCAAKDGVI